MPSQFTAADYARAEAALAAPKAPAAAEECLAAAKRRPAYAIGCGVGAVLLVMYLVSSAGADRDAQLDVVSAAAQLPASGGAAAGAVAAGGAAASLAKCASRTKNAQVGFFGSHACWFDQTNSPGWGAAKLYLDARRQVRRSGKKQSFELDKCAFVTVGLSDADQIQGSGASGHPARGLRYPQTPSGVAVTASTEEWLRRTAEVGAFEECTTFTYVNEEAIDVVVQGLEGQRQAYVQALWNAADGSLDAEFDRIQATLLEATVFVKVHVRAFESDVFKNFQRGLRSGNVPGVVWEREVVAQNHVRTLKDEVDFFASFGYAVYLTSAQKVGLGADYEAQSAPAAYLRLDGGMWDYIYAVPNARLALSLIAVKKGHPLQRKLDTEQGLCPAYMSLVSGSMTCECNLENFQTVGLQCSLANLVLASSGSPGAASRYPDANGLWPTQ